MSVLCENISLQFACFCLYQSGYRCQADWNPVKTFPDRFKPSLVYCRPGPCMRWASLLPPRAQTNSTMGSFVDRVPELGGLDSCQKVSRQIQTFCVLLQTGYLGQADRRSHHGGCDLIRGSKWIANNWIAATTFPDRFKPSVFYDGP